MFRGQFWGREGGCITVCLKLAIICEKIANLRVKIRSYLIFKYRAYTFSSSIVFFNNHSLILVGLVIY